MEAVYPFNCATHFLIIFVSLLIFIFFLQTTESTPSPQLSPGKPLLDGSTLVSPSGIFELGFFSPNRSAKRYVGIWYLEFTASTVLWVANRNSPALTKSGSLAIAGDGNLVVIDGNNVLWSSNVTFLQSNESTAVLTDTGNFVLSNSNSNIWQSFDHPTDTYLPGMKVGLDLITNVNQVFTSWRSTDDPAPGKFSIGIAPDQSTQIFIWEGNKPRWRSGRWNGQVFIGIQNMVPTYIYGFKLSNFEQEKKMYFYYTQLNSSHRYVIMPDGMERHLVWAKDTMNWYQFWAQPITPCEVYNQCGDYATCTDSTNGNPPACICLKGFEWGSGSLSGECVRRTQLHCDRRNGSISVGGSEQDVFYLMQGVKLPDLSDWDSGPTNESQCEEACLSNCSCKAYSYVTGIGCLIWGRDIVDIHLLSSGGNDFYLRLAASEFDEHKGLKSYFIVIIVLAVVTMVAGGIFLIWKNKSRLELCYRRVMKRQESLMDGNRSVVDPSRDFSAMFDLHEQGKNGNDVPLFSFLTIEEATQSFSSSNLLGEGGFGPVFKGILPGGQEIAVKRLSRSSGQGMEEFKNEVILIAKLQHRNLVKLLGYCVRREDKMLIYEYMANKSLDFFIFDSSKKLLLDWKMRYAIIEGIARGLLYLHRDSRLLIVHRDLKASNILLDEHMNPKISDFGMARIFGNDGNETATKRVVGTYGYMSPEYAMQGLFSAKSDVYSFGVLLIEIVSGKRNGTYYNSEMGLDLLGYAWKLFNEGKWMELVEPSMRSSYPEREVSRCIKVGLLCVQDRANDRPAMSSVVVMLEDENSTHLVPRQPTFAGDMSHSETESSTLDQNIASVNASITILAGR